MADIVFGATAKKIVRLGTKLVKKKLGTDTKVINQDLRHCQNQAVRALHTILCAGFNQVTRKHQRETTRELGEFGLWVLYKDTAYRDMFFWIVYQMLKRADKLLPLIEPYVKPPEEWQPNLWDESKKLTQEKRKKGELPDYMKSMEETVFTPSIQKERHKKILGEK